MKLAAAARVVTPDPEHAEANIILFELKLAADLRDTSCIAVSGMQKIGSLDL